MLYSVLVIPYVGVAVVSDGAAIGLWWCRLTKIAAVFLTLGCTLSVLLIAVDRYCAVMIPLHYSMTITRARCSYMIMTIWLLAFAVASLPLAGFGHDGVSGRSVQHDATHSAASHEDDVLTEHCDCWSTVTSVLVPSQRLWYSGTVTCLGFIAPLLSLCWMYACMYRAARRSSVRVRRHSVSANPGSATDVILQETGAGGGVGGGGVSSGECTPIGGGSNTSGGSSLLSHHTNFHAFKKALLYRGRSSSASLSIVSVREEGKAAQTGLLVTASFVFCWFPYFVFVILEALPDWKPVPALGRTMAQHLTFVGCALNPFVYVYRNRIIWKDARHVLMCGGGRGDARCPLQRHHPKTPLDHADNHHPRQLTATYYHHISNNCVNVTENDNRRSSSRDYGASAWRPLSVSSRRLAFRSLIRVSTEDQSSSSGSLVETIPLHAVTVESRGDNDSPPPRPPPPLLPLTQVLDDGDNGSRATGAFLKDGDRTPTSTARQSGVDWSVVTVGDNFLQVEPIRGSRWSLPNQKTVCVPQAGIGERIGSAEIRRPKVAPPNVFFSSEFNLCNVVNNNNVGYPYYYYRRGNDISPEGGTTNNSRRSSSCCTATTNNYNNKMSKHGSNNNNYNNNNNEDDYEIKMLTNDRRTRNSIDVAADNHLRVSGPRIFISGPERCHPRHQHLRYSPQPGHSSSSNRYASASTSMVSLLKVTPLSQSCPGTTL